MTETKLCLDCGKPLSGRSDKKFCDDACRNNYNNKQNSDRNAQVNRINAILKKNRKIIESLIPAEGKITLAEKKLKEAGFNFDYITGIYETKTGTIYRLCYEFGYMRLDDGRFVLVKRDQH